MSAVNVNKTDFIILLSVKRVYSSLFRSFSSRFIVYDVMSHCAMLRLLLRSLSFSLVLTPSCSPKNVSTTRYMHQNPNAFFFWKFGKRKEDGRIGSTYWNLLAQKGTTYSINLDSKIILITLNSPFFGPIAITVF